MFFATFKRTNNMGDMKFITNRNIIKSFERIAKEIIKLIRESHAKGKNLLGQDMNSLGLKGSGYSNHYINSGDFKKFGKTRFVNLTLTGAFHNSLEYVIKENKEDGSISLDIKADFRRKKGKKRILKITKVMNNPFPQFETFEVSDVNKQKIFSLFKNSKKLIIEFYFLQNYLKIMGK